MTLSLGTPLVSVLVAVDSDHPRRLRRTLDALVTQHDDPWEVVVGVGAGVGPSTRALLSGPGVTAINLLDGPQGDTIALVNRAAAAATGRFLTCVGVGDVLGRDALRAITVELTAHPDDPPDLLYTDEARLTADGVSIDATHKPDWSPELLRARMYLGAATFYQRAVWHEAGGLDPGMSGAEWHDLALRVTERGGVVRHLSRIGHRRRLLSTVERAEATRHDERRAAATVRAVSAHLTRTGVVGTVEATGRRTYRVHRTPAGPRRVSVVIPSVGAAAEVRGRTRVMVVEAVRSVLAAAASVVVDVLVVLSERAPVGTAETLVALDPTRVRIVPWAGGFNFSAQVNLGVLRSDGEFVLLLNDDVEVITPDWLDVLVGLAAEPDVGLVGAMLLYEDGTVQHAGQTVRRGGAEHIGLGRPGDDPGPDDAFLVDREVVGVTAACAMTRRAVFEEVGGLSPALPINFNDVDLGQKVWASGRRVVWTPHARLYHFESRSRVARVASAEINTLNDRWGALIVSDPFWGYPDVAAPPADASV